MPRQKLSEYRAKVLLSQALGQSYQGLPFDTTEPGWRDQIKSLPRDQRYVVKVDEGIKGRYKKGLIYLDRTSYQLPRDISSLTKKGFRHILVEPHRPHAATGERYLALDRQRGGIIMTYSRKGGIDVESHADSLTTVPLKSTNPAAAAKALGLPPRSLAALIQAFDEHYFSFLEVNPLVVENNQPYPLDAAVLVDSAAEPLVGSQWSVDDIRTSKTRHPQEQAVAQLASQSQASFSLEVINPDGQIFLLLSGGGASIVVADEIANQGLGATLGNYGEYSGNPSAEEAYLYAREVITLMLASTATQKVLIIGGGVANFTDVRITFQGLIRALQEHADELQRSGVKIFVRRGGPHDTDGLQHMHTFLVTHHLLGLVAGSDLPLSDIVTHALANLKGEQS